jgi:hypothetical protein
MCKIRPVICTLVFLGLVLLSAAQECTADDYEAQYCMKPMPLLFDVFLTCMFSTVQTKRLARFDLVQKEGFQLYWRC